MTLDKFTIKAQEAVQAAVNTAQMNGQQVIEPVHILKGVLEKAKDVTTFIFQKLGVNGTCTYTQRSIGEGEGRHDLHLPETRCERPTDRDARGQRDPTSAEGTGRSTLSL